jgi:hypothetical protein
MLRRYIQEAMKRALYKTLDDRNCFAQIPGIAGVWANERTLNRRQEVPEEWLIPKVRDRDSIPPLGGLGCRSKLHS